MPTTRTKTSCAKRDTDRTAPIAGALARRKSATLETNSAASAETSEELAALTNDEVWARWIELRKTPESDERAALRLRNVLVERHLPLVRFIAEKLARNLPRHVEVDSLVSAGVFGLIDAIRGFDTDRNVLFKTYAATRVRGSIIDMLRSVDWVPRLVRTRAAEIERAISRLSAMYDREPTQAELAAELDLDPQSLATQLQDAKLSRLVSFVDVTEGDETDAHGPSSLADPRALRPEEIVHGRQALSALMSSFTPREQFILKQYYEVDHTMNEIAEMLGVTESRISQIHSNLLARLKCIAERQQRDGNL